MEDLICIDTSVLIEYFRTKNKAESFFPQLSLKYTGFIVSTIVHFEIYIGCTPHQKLFWDNLFSDFLILPFTQSISEKAIIISKELKKHKSTIEFKDLGIAATAVNHNFPLATLNEKHFKAIEDLKLITPSSLI